MPSNRYYTVNVCSRRLCLRKLTDFGDLVGRGAASLASAGFRASAFCIKAGRTGVPSGLYIICGYLQGDFGGSISKP